MKAFEVEKMPSETAACGVPEMRDAVLFHEILEQILASLPPPNEAYEAACAQREACEAASRVVAQLRRDPSLDIASAIAAASRDIARTMDEAGETHDEQQVAAASKKKSKVKLSKGKIRLRSNNQWVEGSPDEAALEKLQQRADAMFASGQLGQGMKIVEYGGIHYLQMPMQGTAQGQFALVALRDIQSITLQQQPGGGYQLTLQMLSATGLQLAPHFSQRDMPLPSQLLREVLGDLPETREALEAKLRESRQLLQQLIDAYDAQQERLRGLKQHIPPPLHEPLQGLDALALDMAAPLPTPSLASLQPSGAMLAA